MAKPVYLCTFLLCTIVLAFSCKTDKKKGTDNSDEIVSLKAIKKIFPDATFPYIIADSTLTKKNKDTTTLRINDLKQLVPDSVFAKITGKGIKPRLFTMAKAGNKGDSYLVIKAITGETKKVYLLGFDEKDSFVAYLPLQTYTPGQQLNYTTTIDNSYTITKLVTKKNKDGSYSEGREVYGLDKSLRQFALILKDQLGDAITEFVNPIEQLPTTNSYAGDYTQGKNIVSIRDGGSPDKLQFLIYIEKNGGKCKGEVKGSLNINKSGRGAYKINTDPCELSFHFNGDRLTVKELENCGTKRGLDCKFDGNFERKK